MASRILRAVERHQTLFIVAFTSMVLLGIATVPMPPPKYVAVAELRIAHLEDAAPIQALLDSSDAASQITMPTARNVTPEQVAESLESNSCSLAVARRLGTPKARVDYDVSVTRPYSRLRITANGQTREGAVATVDAVVSEWNERRCTEIGETLQFIRGQVASLDRRLGQEQDGKTVLRLSKERQILQNQLEWIVGVVTARFSKQQDSLVTRPRVERIGADPRALVAAWMVLALMVASAFALILDRPQHRQRAN